MAGKERKAFRYHLPGYVSRGNGRHEQVAYEAGAERSGVTTATDEYAALRNALLHAGGRPMLRYLPDMGRAMNKKGSGVEVVPYEAPAEQPERRKPATKVHQLLFGD